jgi:hypothetical protein
MAYQEVMEASLEEMEANPGELQYLAVHQEVPKEETAVEMIGALKDVPGVRHLAVGRRQQSNKRTQGDGGSRQKLAAARGRLTSRTVPAPRKGFSRHGPGKYDVVHVRGETSGTAELQQWLKEPRPETAATSRNLGCKRIFNETVRQNFRLEVEKLVVRISIGLWK